MGPIKKKKGGSWCYINCDLLYRVERKGCPRKYKLKFTGPLKEPCGKNKKIFILRVHLLGDSVICLQAQNSAILSDAQFPLLPSFFNFLRQLSHFVIHNIMLNLYFGIHFLPRFLTTVQQYQGIQYSAYCISNNHGKSDNLHYSAFVTKVPYKYQLFYCFKAIIIPTFMANMENFHFYYLLSSSYQSY